MNAVELKPIKAWPVRKREYIGKYRDENGHGLSGWFVREYRTVKHMLALSNGNLCSRYRFPNVSIPFKSLMHRWENLWHVGGWNTVAEDGSNVNTHESLFNDVAAGLKPMGFFSGPRDQIERYARRAIELGLPRSINAYPWCEGYAELGVCQPGRIGELFDIEAVITSYRLLGNTSWCNFDFLSDDEDKLREVAEHQLCDYLSDWDYANPSSNFDCILVGLLLGFPLESTVAFILGTR